MHDTLFGIVKNLTLRLLVGMAPRTLPPYSSSYCCGRLNAAICNICGV